MNFTAEWDSISTYCVGSDMSAICRSQNRGKQRATTDGDYEVTCEIKLQSMEMRLLTRRHVTTLAIVVLALLAGSGVGTAQNDERRKKSLSPIDLRRARDTESRRTRTIRKRQRAKCKADQNSLLFALRSLPLHRAQKFLIRSSRKWNGM